MRSRKSGRGSKRPSVKRTIEAERRGKSVLGLLIVFVVIVAAVAGGWYLLRPKSQGGSQTTQGNSQTSQGSGEVNNPPAITLLYPKGGETLSDVVGIKWSASDPNNDVLVITIQYTTDPAPYCPTCPPQRWHTISTNEQNDGAFNWDTTDYPNGRNYQIKVIVSDGETTAQAVSGTFFVEN